MHTGKIMIAAVLLLGLSVRPGAGATGWVEENGTWVLKDNNGSVIVDDWKNDKFAEGFPDANGNIDEGSPVLVPGGTSTVYGVYQQLIANDSPVIPLTVSPAVDPALAALAEKLAGKLDPSQLAQLPALLHKALSDENVQTLRAVLGKLGPDQTAQLLGMLQSGRTPDIKTLTDMAKAAGVTTGELLTMTALVGNLNKSQAGQELLALLKDIGGAFSSVSLPDTLNAEAGNLFQGVLELVLALRNAGAGDVDKLVAALQKLDGEALANLLQALAQASPEQLQALLASLFQGDTNAALTLASTVLGVTRYAVYDPNTDTNVYYPTPEAAEAASRFFWAQYRKTHPSATLLYTVEDVTSGDLGSYNFTTMQIADGFGSGKGLPGNARVAGSLAVNGHAGSGYFGFDVNLGSGSITNAGMNYAHGIDSFNMDGGIGQASGGTFSVGGMRGNYQLGGSPQAGVGSMTGTTQDNFGSVKGKFEILPEGGGGTQFDGTFSGGKQ